MPCKFWRPTVCHISRCRMSFVLLWKRNCYMLHLCDPASALRLIELRLNHFCAGAWSWAIATQILLTLNSLFSDSDEQLFDRIKHNSQHILHQYLSDRPDLNYSLRSRHHNKTLLCNNARLLNWMTEILLLEIYTNIVINWHGTCCYLTLLFSCSLYFLYFNFFTFYSIFVAVAFDNLNLQKWMNEWMNDSYSRGNWASGRIYLPGANRKTVDMPPK